MASDVTVLIPSYNPGRYLIEAVKSVFEQTYTNWKIILVDDASTDNSLSNIKGFLRDPRVKIVRNQKNVGQSNSLNIALKLVDTPYVIQLDADDCFYPNTIEVLKRAAERQPQDVAVFYGNFMRFWDVSSGKSGNKEQLRKSRLYQDGYDFLLADCTIRPRFYRTAALKRVGGWPTDDAYEGRYVEDRRILLRLFQHYRCYWVDKTLYRYRKHSSNMTNDGKTNCKVVEWIVRDALNRWGNKYEPVFAYERGWNRMIQLVPRTIKSTNNISLSYGGLMPELKEQVMGGRVKLIHLGKIFPEKKLNYNILYLISSYLPSSTEERVKVCKKIGIKIVWNQNGVAFPAWAGEKYQEMNNKKAKLLSQADWVIYQSEFCKMSADKFLGPYNGPFSILYNCVDTTAFIPPQTVPPRTPIQLLVMGSHFDKERVTLPLDTLAQLLKRGISAELKIAGNLKWPGAKEEIAEKIKSLRLEKHVIVSKGYLQEEAPRIYQGAHIVLHFKYNDPSPTVPIEAMACGVPVVGSRSGGMTELLGEDGGVTLKVPHSWDKMHYPSAEAAADAVELIMKNWSDRSAKARKRAVEHFSKEKWLEEHQKIFRKLIDNER